MEVFLYRVISLALVRMLKLSLLGIEYCYKSCGNQQKQLLDKLYFSSKILQHIFVYHLGDHRSPTSSIQTQLQENIVDLASKNALKVSIFEITSKDGYILSVMRCSAALNPSEESQQSNHKPIVLILPGLVQDADLVMNPPAERNLVSYLLEQGYDVWIGNNRGSKYSSRHVKYSLHPDSRYWRYALDELAAVDFPCFVSFIKEYTHCHRISCIAIGLSNYQVLLSVAIDDKVRESIHRLICITPGEVFIAQYRHLFQSWISFFYLILLRTGPGRLSTILDVSKRVLQRASHALLIRSICKLLGLPFFANDTATSSKKGDNDDLLYSLSSRISSRLLMQLLEISRRSSLSPCSGRKDIKTKLCNLPFPILGLMGDGQLNVDAVRAAVRSVGYDMELQTIPEGGFDILCATDKIDTIFALIHHTLS
jgi:pimeloyl-ACP methyl ester carboxylesterase